MYRVFLADDERWVTVGLKKMIEKTGRPFQVIGEAYDGVTTLEEVTEKKPEVVFTDIRMPGLDGLSLLEKIGERLPDTKVVIISGYAEFSYAKKAVRMQAFDYLLKPIDQEQLDEILDRLDDFFCRDPGARDLSGGGGAAFCQSDRCGKYC